MPQRGATIFEAKKPTRRRLPPQKKRERERESREGKSETPTLTTIKQFMFVPGA